MIHRLTEANYQKELPNLIAKAKASSLTYSLTPINSILATLDKVGQFWRHNTEYKLKALSIIEEDTGFYSQSITELIELLPELLSQKNLTKRLCNELSSIEILDQFSDVPNSKIPVKAVPKGLVLHISAGNIFLGMIDSLIMALITKNVSLIKLSSNNLRFPELFLQSLAEVDQQLIISPAIHFLHWKGGNQKIEKQIKQSVDCILAWGGEEMVKSYKDELPITCSLIEFGPKISFQAITTQAYESYDTEEAKKDFFARVAADIATWDQAACASAQNIFLQKEIDIQDFAQRLAQELRNFKIPRRKLQPDEQVEQIKETARAVFNQANFELPMIKGEDFLIRRAESDTLEPSLLGRVVLLKHFSDPEDLKSKISPWQYYLQNIGLECTSHEIAHFQEVLATTGLKRFSAIGSMLSAQEPAPHDGLYPLTRLVNLLSWEKSETDLEFAKKVLMPIPFYANIDWSTIHRFEEIPLINGEVIKGQGYQHFINPETPSGIFFASGGTTGNPKFLFYTHQEFEESCKMLAQGLRACGLKANDKVANLFVAGNLWSSFRAISGALQHVGALELPIGGLCPLEDMVCYLKHFKPKAAMGIPGLFSDLATYCLKHKISLDIPQIFYAGENLSQKQKKFFEQVFNTTKFNSAGYASVDAGVIGYQDGSCAHGEHYLFSNVLMECIDGQAVISNLSRKAMPIIRYETGDRVEILGKDAKGLRFKLLGRMDSQIQLWSCKFKFEDLAYCLKQCLNELPLFQIILNDDSDDQLREFMTIQIEEEAIKSNNISGLIEKLAKTMHEYIPDINQTHSLAYLKERISIKSCSQLYRNSRTGKILQVIDQRN